MGAVLAANVSLETPVKTEASEELIDESELEPIKCTLFDYNDYTQQPSGDTYYNTQKNYHMNSLNIGNTWDNYRGDGVTVAVIDTGCNYSHNDFVYYNQSGTSISDLSACFTSGSNNVVTTTTVKKDGWSVITDTNGHGTNVASTIASRIQGEGCVGVAPNVNLMFLKAANLMTNEVSSAIKYAADNGADIISMSLGLYSESFTSPYSGKDITGYSNAKNYYQSAITYAHNKGCIILAAAANDNTDHCSYPACCDYVIGVGALASQSRSTKAGYSNYNGSDKTSSTNNNVDVTVCGSVYVASKDSNTSYTSNQGTSFSCPITAAALALYLQKNSGATVEQATQDLYNSCEDIGDAGWDSNFGYGCVDISALVNISYDVTGVSLDKEYAYVYDDGDDSVKKTTITATVEPSYATNKNINWSISDSTVASISKSTSTSGESITITGLKAGTTTLTATSVDGGFEDSCTITVIHYVSSEFTINTIPTLYVESTHQLSVTWTYETPSITELVYESSNTDVATISDSGLITAIAEGTTDITVMSTDDVQEVTVTVTNEPPGDYVLVTNVNELSSGDKLIFVNETNNVMCGPLTSDYLSAVGVTINNHVISSLPSGSEVFTLGGSTGSWTLTAKTTNALLYGTSSSLYSTSASGSYSTWSISISNNKAEIKAGGTCSPIYYNSGSPRFKPYSNPQSTFQLYRKNIVDPTKQLKSISVSGMTTSYFVGDTYSFNGTVTATWQGDIIGTVSGEVTPTSVSSPDMSTVGSKTVTVTYTDTFGTASTNFQITVQAVVLSSISISGYKTSFTQGDAFSFGGTVTAHYNNSTTKDVTSSSTFSGYDLSTVSASQEVTVSYTENGVTKTTKYNIEVLKPSSEVTLENIDFTNSNNTCTDSKNNTWTASGGTAGKYYAIKSTSAKITNDSALAIDTTKTVTISARVGYYGGSNAYVNVVAKNENGVVISNKANNKPSSSDVTVTLTLTFTDTSSNEVFIEFTGSSCSDSKYLRFYSATITYTPGTIAPKVTNLSIDPTSAELDLYASANKKTVTITPTVTFETGADTTVTWSISDASKATISRSSGTKDQTCVVTAVAITSSAITVQAKCGNKTATCSITIVNTTPILITKINLSATDHELTKGSSETISITSIEPSNATNKNIDWSTNSSNITINSSTNTFVNITASGEIGSYATITASAKDGSGITSSFKVTISAVTRVLEGFESTVKYHESFDSSKTVLKVNGTVVTPTSTNYSVDTTVLGVHQISAVYDGVTVTANVTVTNNGANHTLIPSSVTTTFTSKSWGDANNGWTSTKDGYEFDKTNGVQITSSVSGANATSKVSYSNINKIVINYSSSSKGVGNISIKVGSNTANSFSVSKGTSSTNKTFNLSTPQSGNVLLSVTCSTSSVYVKSITIYTTNGGTYDWTGEDQATSWSNFFINETRKDGGACTLSNRAERVTALKALWSNFKAEYNYMINDSKDAFFTSNVAKIVEARNHYLYIISQYEEDGLEDFIRNSSDGSLQRTNSTLLLNSVSNNTGLIVIVSLISISTIGGYIFIRKRRDN